MAILFAQVLSFSNSHQVQKAKTKKQLHCILLWLRISALMLFFSIQLNTEVAPGNDKMEMTCHLSNCVPGKSDSWRYLQISAHISFFCFCLISVSCYPRWSMIRSCSGCLIVINPKSYLFDHKKRLQSISPLTNFA